MPTQPESAIAESAAIESVEIVLPSSPPHVEEHLVAGIEWLRAEGVSVTPPRRRSHSPLRHLAGTDEVRAGELVAALTKASVDAVWCGRGGSGALRTLEVLSPANSDRCQRPSARDVEFADLQAQGALGDISDHPLLPLVGLSDVTALLLWRAFGPDRGAAIHGPVVTQLPRLDAASQDALRSWIRRPVALPTVATTAPPLLGGQALGEVIGGNLSLLASCVGTPQAPRTAGRILLIEEVGEPAYRIDRLLTQLYRGGCLDGIVAVAQGTFTDCPQPDAVRACLLDWARRLGVPWTGPLPVGHGAACRPVALGARYRLSADEGTLVPLERLDESVRRRRT